jgi:hypothetical protein
VQNGKENMSISRTIPFYAFARVAKERGASTIDNGAAIRVTRLFALMIQPGRHHNGHAVELSHHRRIE